MSKTPCRDCGALIDFVLTKNNRLQPVNADGVPHGATCAARKERPALPGDTCISCGSKDVERLPGTGPHHGAIRCRDCGAHRWLRKPVVA